MKTCPVHTVQEQLLGKWRAGSTKPIPLWRRHSVIPESEIEENTHPRRGINKSPHYLQPQLNSICYAFFFFFLILKGVEGQFTTPLLT